MSFYSINNGAMMLTPSNHSQDLFTLTIALEGQYAKLRNLRVSSDPMMAFDEGFFTSEPIQVGSGRISLLFDQNTLADAIGKIADPIFKPQIRELIRANLTEKAVVAAVADPRVCSALTDRPEGEVGPNPSALFQGIMLYRQTAETVDALVSVFEGLKLKDRARFSCLMNASRKLEIVAKFCLSGHGGKKIFEVDSVWAAGGTTGPFFPKAVVVKGRRVVIENEESISFSLIEHRVPHIMPNRALPPNCESDKKSLVMELAPHGDFAQYSKNHYDSSTGYILPEYRKQHILCMYYMAETLAAMHASGVVYGDVRTENIVVMNVDPLDVRLIDFGLTREVGRRVYGMPGTYPPPELVEAYDRDFVQAYFELAQLPDRDTVSEVDVPLKAIEVIKAHGIPQTCTIDLWAFGILLLKAMFDPTREEYKLLFSLFTYTTPFAMADEARKQLLIKIEGNHDPVVQLAIQLLSKQPSMRPSMQDVKARLATE